MSWHRVFVEYVEKELKENQEKNHRLGLRYLAQKLEIAPGSLSGLLSKKRKFSWNKALSIAAKLEESDLVCLRMIKLKNQEGLAGPRLDLLESETISESALELLNDPDSFTLFSILDCKNLTLDLKGICGYWNRPETFVLEKMKVLIDLELVKENKGLYQLTQKTIQTPDNIPSGIIRNYHKKVLIESIERLQNLNFDQRDLTSFTFSSSETQLNEVKKILRESSQKIAKTLQKGEKEKPYRLNIQFYPVLD